MIKAAYFVGNAKKSLPLKSSRKAKLRKRQSQRGQYGAKSVGVVI